MQQRVLRTASAAAYVGWSPSTLEKSRLSGDGPPFIRIGRRTVGYLVDDLDHWLEERRRRSTSDLGVPIGDRDARRTAAAPDAGGPQSRRATSSKGLPP